MTFQNRKHAGQLLAQLLLKHKDLNPLILALPRGGVPVAVEVAKVLSAPLDVLIVRKIGAPYHSELAVGAICENGTPIYSEHILAQLGLGPGDLHATVTLEKNEVRRQILKFRSGRELPKISGRTVIVIDDGLATGASMTAAVRHLRSLSPSKIIVAVPVSATRTAHALRAKVDEVVVVEERDDLLSVGQWYKNFLQVEDEEVLSLLKMAEDSSQSQFRVQSRAQAPAKEVFKLKLADAVLEAELTTVPEMKAVVIFAHGSGSSRKSPRNLKVAKVLNSFGFGTLLFDLLTAQEAEDRRNVFDIDKLSQRLRAATRWLRTAEVLKDRKDLRNIPVGYFGASTGAGAALLASSKLSAAEDVYAIVSRGGRPDLAGAALDLIRAPTLLLVGGLDTEVIELNQQAKVRLSMSKLSIIPEATHVFEEPGALEEVARQAAEWFLLGLEKHNSIEAAIEKKFVSILSENDWDPLIQSLKDKRVVMLGEATHGTQEFYQARRMISQRLIKDHGFKFIAVEGDWPDTYRLNRYIQNGEGGSSKSVLISNHRWPTWMWANTEIVKLAEWMQKQRAGFYGLDIYSLFESMDEVMRVLKDAKPELQKAIQKGYECFLPYERDEIAYARSLIKNAAGCEAQVITNLQKLLSLRLENISMREDELFSLQQNARIIANAESYYRSMFASDANSWNLRDSHMMETLDTLLEKSGEAAKAIVWAHNTHIGDYRATDMAAGGYVNLGGLARQSYGPENVALVGFGSYQGEVTAAHAWAAPEEVMPLPAAHDNSYEHWFHQVASRRGVNEGFILLEEQSHDPLAQILGHRAVGVVYDPKHEKRGNYVPTQLSKRYDAFVFVDRTQALKPLRALYTLGEFPETWPSGQ